MSRKILIVLSLLAIFLLAYFCIKINAPAIEDDLVTRSEAALSAENMTWVGVVADGRELSLTGTAPSKEIRQRAGDIVAAVWGVRSVDNQMTVERTDNDKLESYDLVVTYDGVSVLLDGYVPDEATRIDIVAAAKQHLGDTNVIDKMKIVAGAPDGWGETVIQAALAHLDDYVNMTASFHDTELSVSGRVISKKLYDTLQQHTDESLKPPYSLSGFDVKVNESKADVAAADCQRLFNDLLSERKIYFQVSRAVIRRESAALIDELAEVALKCPETRIEIAGHTDSSGPRSMNQKLSEMRAQAVVERLKMKNVDPERLIAVGYGEMRPIADNSTDEGRAKNRRIEFTILGD